jgi:hypothetical protein
MFRVIEKLQLWISTIIRKKKSSVLRRCRWLLYLIKPQSKLDVIKSKIGLSSRLNSTSNKTDLLCSQSLKVHGKTFSSEVKSLSSRVFSRNHTQHTKKCLNLIWYNFELIIHSGKTRQTIKLKQNQKFTNFAEGNIFQMKFLEYFWATAYQTRAVEKWKNHSIKRKKIQTRKNDLSEIYILLHRLLISLSLTREILMNDLIWKGIIWSRRTSLHNKFFHRSPFKQGFSLNQKLSSMNYKFKRFEVHWIFLLTSPFDDFQVKRKIVGKGMMEEILP